MCTRFVYNGIDKIVGFNFDIDLSVWDHTVITEENRFYIGIKMPDGMYHSFHGINKNGNVGTLLYVHGNENARYIESEDCITISELTEKFIKAEISFDKALDIVKKKKDIPYSRREYIMKKRYLILAGLLVMTVAAAGCGKKKTTETAPVEVTATPTPEVTKAVDMVDMQQTADEDIKNVMGEKTSTASKIVFVNNTCLLYTSDAPTIA